MWTGLTKIVLNSIYIDVATVAVLAKLFKVLLFVVAEDILWHLHSHLYLQTQATASYASRELTRSIFFLSNFSLIRFNLILILSLYTICSCIGIGSSRLSSCRRSTLALAFANATACASNSCLIRFDCIVFNSVFLQQFAHFFLLINNSYIIATFKFPSLQPFKIQPDEKRDMRRLQRLNTELLRDM